MTNCCASIFLSVLCRSLVLQIAYCCGTQKGFSGQASLGNHPGFNYSLTLGSPRAQGALKHVGNLGRGEGLEEQGMADFLNLFDHFNLHSVFWIISLNSFSQISLWKILHLVPLVFITMSVALASTYGYFNVNIFQYQLSY